MKIVKLDAIRIDGNTQCRVVIDQPTVYQYLENMKDGDVFPLMETMFDGATYWLTDGFHRYHAYKLLGIKDIEITYKVGTLKDAQLEALQANSSHGKPLTNEDKRNKVNMALTIEGFDKKTDYEIAKLCKVSKPFVASIRNPEKKQKQAEDKIKHVIKKAKEIAENSNQITNATEIKPDSNINYGPDEDEIKASEMALEANNKAVFELLESDDKLANTFEDLKKANLLIAQLTLRIHGLMNEKNEAIKMVKKLQAENDKLKGKK